MKRAGPKKRVSSVIEDQITPIPQGKGDDPGIEQGSAFGRGFAKKKKNATKPVGPFKAAHADPWDA